MTMPAVLGGVLKDLLVTLGTGLQQALVTHALTQRSHSCLNQDGPETAMRHVVQNTGRAYQAHTGIMNHLYFYNMHVHCVE